MKKINNVPMDEDNEVIDLGDDCLENERPLILPSNPFVEIEGVTNNGTEEIKDVTIFNHTKSTLLK